MPLSANEEMLIIVAKSLPPELKDHVVFLGGSVVSLLITDQAFSGIRPTRDVDMIVDASNRSRFHAIEEVLRNAGFRQVVDKDPPVICRWRINSVIVDLMPCDDSILGFSNKWYKEAVKNFILVNLAGTDVRIVSAPYFIATKIEAFLGRGNNDFLCSADLEDIITILDGRSEIVSEIKAADKKLQSYIAENFSEWLHNKDFINALPSLIAPDPTSQDRFSLIIDKMKIVSALLEI
jgi:predicted nucleotidyltransferase